MDIFNLLSVWSVVPDRVGASFAGDGKIMLLVAMHESRLSISIKAGKPSVPGHILLK